MAKTTFEPLSSLADQWSTDRNSPGSRDFLFNKLTAAICDLEFFPEGLAVQAHRLLVNITAFDDAPEPQPHKIRIKQNGKPERIPAEPLPDFEPVPDLISLHSYFHPLLDKSCNLSSEITEDVGRFFDWLKNSEPDQRPEKVNLMLRHLAIDRKIFRRWCETQSLPVPTFLVAPPASTDAGDIVTVSNTLSPSSHSKPVFSAAYWNLVQTLGWIYFRDRDLVEEVGQDEKPSQISLVLAAETLPPCLPSLRASKEALYEALRAEDVTAVGLLNNEGDPRTIPAAFWTHGQFYEEPETARTSTLAPWSSSWHGLRFPSIQVRRVWPASKSVKPEPHANSFALLSFEQLAHRWIAENPDIGLKAEHLAVDLVRCAESGSFLSTPSADEPNAPNFDRQLSKCIHTYDQWGEPAGPHQLVLYVSAGPSGSEWAYRLNLARDIEVSLSAVGRWLETEAGILWTSARGLKRPRFISPALSPTVISLISEERRCTEWITEMMRTGEPPRPKAELKEEALSEFKISGAGFQRCWTAAVSTSNNIAWSKSGPRKR